METNTLEREGMRFILNGRTFDTASASQVAVLRGVHDQYNSGFSERGNAEEVRFEEVLYRTANGALFIHEHKTMKFQKGKPVVVDEAREVTPEVAVTWITEYGAAIHDATGLPLPDEA